MLFFLQVLKALTFFFKILNLQDRQGCPFTYRDSPPDKAMASPSKTEACHTEVGWNRPLSSPIPLRHEVNTPSIFAETQHSPDLGTAEVIYPLVPHESPGNSVDVPGNDSPVKLWPVREDGPLFPGSVTLCWLRASPIPQMVVWCFTASSIPKHNLKLKFSATDCARSKTWEFFGRSYPRLGLG